MKKLFRFFLIIMMSMIFNASYAQTNLDPEFISDEDSVDYDSPSVQISAPDDEDDSIETRERSEYNVDMRPYVRFTYVSTRTKIEHK